MENIVLRNNVSVFGKGDRTLLLAHGFGCDQNMWRFITPAFKDNYQIVVFDYVGCGKSDANAYHLERYSSLDGYAQDVIEICKSLDLKDVTFVGHSVSAMIGAVAVIKEPTLFDSMIWIGPSPCYINDDGYTGGFDKKDLDDLMDVMENNYVGWANFLAPVIMKNDDRPELANELEESFCATDPFITKRFAKVTFFSDNRDDLLKIDIPVLIMQCTDDIIAPEFVADFIASQIKNSTVAKMSATGHCPHLSHPKETIEIMQGFLTKNVYEDA